MHDHEECCDNKPKPPKFKRIARTKRKGRRTTVDAMQFTGGCLMVVRTSKKGKTAIAATFVKGTRIDRSGDGCFIIVKD